MTTSVLSIAISGITPADQGAMAEGAWACWRRR